MTKLKCPHCNEVFTPDESGLADIIKQVRDEQFDNELKEREKLFLAAKKDAVQIATAETTSKLLEEQSKKDALIAKLEAELKSRDDMSEKDKQLAITEALKKVEQERDSFKSELDKSEQVKALAISDVEKRLIEEKSAKEAEIATLKVELQTAEEKSQHMLALELAKKDTEISELKGNFTTKEAQLKQESVNAIAEISKERDTLANDLKSKENEIALKLSQIKELHQNEISRKDDEVAYYKDFNVKQSTKMLGETLEQHCKISFDRHRSAFKNAYFEKDNDASTGSKGDFIFRDYDDEGNEIVSIMFEMKNEADTTATKKKNEDFLKELDKDRNQKGCEYAVLVSRLEQDNEYYNDGIVDKFYRYPKMYVIRPQFFIPMITVLRNAALNTLTYKTQLALVKSQNIDITNFENDLFSFKTSFDKSLGFAHDRYEEAVDGIDNVIEKLKDIKEALRLFKKHLGSANNKLEDLTVQKLTKNNPTMIAMFEEVNNRIN